VAAALVALPAACGGALGIAWREHHRHRAVQRLRDLEGEEVLYSNRELEKKFRDLESKIEQLSLLMDLSEAVNATLDPEKIYEQALQRLVDRMGYQSAHVLELDHAERTMRPRQSRGELTLDASDRVVRKVAMTGLPVVDNEVARAEATGYRALLAVPLRVKGQTRGVVVLTSREPGCFAEADVELASAVANHVAVAVERAESFRTIEELSRGLEEKVRLRTEELASAYQALQRTQAQLVQREKMASVGQLVAGVAHELNNPIGFVFSNVVTLEDFVGRLRAMLATYRDLALPPAERARAESRWSELKVDYALRYLDAMIHGIRDGAERARKIVGDLRVFARTGDEVWQSVDLHEELDSSLTLLDHLLTDRVAVERRFGAVPRVECIRSEMDQVFLNLLANAAQAIEGRGRITILTRAEDGMAVVEITDTGPGIAADVVGRVFDPFFTTKPVGEGTGLGLSISYEIVKKHGGEITVSSPPSRGATFTVRIPLARDA
jgi:signal transduction histidine kinase